jgi:xanthine dehydrogenase accessory factor
VSPLFLFHTFHTLLNVGRGVKFEDMIRDLLQQLLEPPQAQRAAALCRLVETRGSTPQKPGACMVVFADGAQLGTLGGGCVEAEVKRKALAQMELNTPAIERFQLDDDYGWDDGLICGGRMQVLIDPLQSSAAQHYYQQLHALLSAGQGVIEAIAFDCNASKLSSGTSVLFDANHQPIAVRKANDFASDNTLSEATKLLTPLLPPMSARPRPMVQTGIALLPTLPRCRLIIVGGGHVGLAVARLAHDLDFTVWVVDDREEYISADRFPFAERRLAGKMSDVLPNLEISPDTYCLIVTRGHNHDEEALFHLVNRGARYVGMIGSKRKIRLIFDDLLAEGVSAELLEKVYAPVGLSIGSQSVAEIAVSIAAQLVSHRNLGDTRADA